MEHIVQFAISIDDSAIEEKIYNKAVDNITDEIKKSVRRIMIDREYFNYAEPTEFAEKIFKEWLDEHKTEIINLMSEKLAEKMSKTKAIKEAAVKSVNDI